MNERMSFLPAQPQDPHTACSFSVYKCFSYIHVVCLHAFLLNLNRERNIREKKVNERMSFLPAQPQDPHTACSFSVYKCFSYIHVVCLQAFLLNLNRERNIREKKVNERMSFLPAQPQDPHTACSFSVYKCFSYIHVVCLHAFLLNLNRERNIREKKVNERMSFLPAQPQDPHTACSFSVYKCFSYIHVVCLHTFLFNLNRER